MLQSTENKYRFFIFIPLYYPSTSNLRHAVSLVEMGFDVVFYDNGGVPKYFKESNSLAIYGCGSNIGLSAAVNYVLNLHNYETYKYFLFLDQDTIVSDSFYYPVLKSLSDLNYDSSIGAITFSDYVSSSQVSEVSYLRNSGSIFSINALKNIGLFDESFFVDMADYDISIRLRQAGYSIKLKQIGSFDHCSDQGNKEFIFFGKKITFRKYSSKRLKSIFINSLRLMVRELIKFNFLEFLKLSKGFCNFIILQIIIRYLFGWLK